MQVYNEVHDLVYHGGGGFSYSEVYNMPIYLRRYSLKRVDEFIKLKKEAEEAAYKDSESKYK